MSELYKEENNEENKVLRYVFGLPFLKPQDVEDGFETLMTLKPVTSQMDKFFDYLLDNYITADSRFPPKMWADMKLDSPRTTNCCEAFHSRFNAEFTSAHPNIFAFIEGLKRVQTITYIKLRSKNMTSKRRKQVEKENVIEKAVTNFERGHIDTLKYLKIVSRKFLPKT